ncbi:MAG TPA: hypothetical protein PKD95_04290 [Candidatus Paceibacterota bacterium]|nr:hypothetical protein [Candidatus Paceibacterota bacterium]
MPSKSLLIALAAFAVTATGAQAHVSNKYFNQAGLSTSQVQALSQARDLRRKGEIEKARDVLVEAGVTEETINSLRKAARSAKSDIEAAVVNNDFAAFRQAILGTPLYDIVNTEADFAVFREAHALKAEGKYREARELMSDIGFVSKGSNKTKRSYRAKIYDELSADQRDAVRAARQANDSETVRAILREAGFDGNKHHSQN